jgi:carbamoyltransferase
MIILGVNFSHDASLTIIKNGKIIASIEEEKTCRVKQQFGWPETACTRLLQEYNIQPSEVDIISFGAFIDTVINKDEIRYRFSRSKSAKNKEVMARVLSYAGLAKIGERDNRKVFEEEVRKLGFSNAKLEFYNHHLCHAVSAWYAAPFHCDLVYTSDGYGDDESMTFYIPDEKLGLKKIASHSYETSVGQFYSGITMLLGFRATRHEGKITGLAAYGKPTELLDKFRSLFKFENGILTRFPFDQKEMLWNKYGLDKNLTLSTKINFHSQSSAGIEYGKNTWILDAWLKEETKGHTKEDIAFACQKVAEEISLQLLDYTIKNLLGGKKIKLALAGGVFANVRINQLLFEHDLVEQVFVQPAMGDSGLSLGAAVLTDLAQHKNMLSGQYRFIDTYLGPDYANDLPAFINEIDHTKYTLSDMGIEAPKTIAQLMKDNVIVGFWHGSMEWGPRALGKRSMILNTFDKSVNDTLNKRLNRTEFMPFAPSVIDYMVSTYMPKYKEGDVAADYMTITYDVAPEYHKQLQAVVHVDGTARPQVVKKETNPYYWQIIDAFYKLTGCGAIVNTSFNVHEEPIVSTPVSAFKALEDDRIDALVLDNYLVRKKN